MASKAGELVLKKSQAACLAALRQHNEAKFEIAIMARLDLIKAARGLQELQRLGLAKQDRRNRWHTTKRGRSCRFKVVPDRVRRNSSTTGSGGRRLLEALDRPRRGDELMEMLGVTRQRIHQLVVKLHAHGHVRVGDREWPLLIVSRTNDKTPLLLRDEERVLSAVPADYVTNATKIRLAAGLLERRTQNIIEQLLASGFIKACDGLRGEPVYRITSAGLKHPQYSKSAHRAQPPRLPVESDRVLTVLSAILDAGSMRINVARDTLKIPHDSIRALMQYLKRKALVQKTERALLAPYELTDKGREALTEMLRRRAA